MEKKETDLCGLSLCDFARVTASGAPTPGGGSVSALLGALAAALGEMVGNLTLGKPGDTALSEEFRDAVARLGKARVKLLRLVEEDAASFDGCMAALKLPKGTEEEKAVRRGALQKSLVKAIEVPVATAETAHEVLKLSLFLARNGKASCVTDAAVCAMAARTAVLGALLNVRINLQSVRDGAYVAEMKEKTLGLEASARNLEEEVLAIGNERT